MSEQFYERFMALFFNFFIVLILVLVTTESILLFIITQNIVFYIIYCGTLVICFLYGFRFFLQFRDFRKNLFLFLCSESLHSLNIDGLRDLALRICLFYRNGASLQDIAREFGLSHPTQAKRQLQKGLHILLEFYEKHGEKVKVLS